MGFPSTDRKLFSTYNRHTLSSRRFYEVPIQSPLRADSVRQNDVTADLLLFLLQGQSTNGRGAHLHLLSQVGEGIEEGSMLTSEGIKGVVGDFEVRVGIVGCEDSLSVLLAPQVTTLFHELEGILELTILGINRSWTTGIVGCAPLALLKRRELGGTTFHRLHM